MDPDKAYDDFLVAMRRGSLDDAQDIAHDLIEWLRNGGCQPTKLNNLSVGDIMRTLQFACTLFHWAIWH